MNFLKFKFVVLIFSIFNFLFIPFSASAKSNSFISIVNPIRGEDFWQEKDQDPATAVEGEMKILENLNLSATWLIRFDALSSQQIINLLKTSSNDEMGLFLEITPTWAREAGVAYHEKQNWHDAGSAFLTGYGRAERDKLIDKSFEKFKINTLNKITINEKTH